MRDARHAQTKQAQQNEIFGIGKKIKKMGFYLDGEMNGHPLWYSPKTGKFFKMDHHKSQEVAKGTLQSILKDSGLK